MQILKQKSIDSLNHVEYLIFIFNIYYVCIQCIFLFLILENLLTFINICYRQEVQNSKIFLIGSSAFSIFINIYLYSLTFLIFATINIFNNECHFSIVFNIINVSISINIFNCIKIEQFYISKFYISRIFNIFDISL